MKKILYIVLLMTIICLPVKAEEFMERALNTWVGYTVNDVIAVWGYPKEEKVIAGRRLFYWTNSHYSVSGNQYGVYGGEYYCNKILEVNKKNKITSWQYEGNSCPSFYFTGSSLVNPKNDVWQIEKLQKKQLKQQKKKLKQEKRKQKKEQKAKNKI